MSGVYSFTQLNNETLLLKIDEDLDEASIAALAQTFKQSLRDDLRGILVDRRGKYARISFEQARDLGKFVAEIVSENEIKVALMETTRSLLSDIFSCEVYKAGGRIASFADMTDARHWLSSEPKLAVQ